MEEQKDSLEGQQEVEEEYSFLQEIIKDEADGGKRLRRDIFRMIKLGLVFGFVACLSFVAFKPWLEVHFESDPEQITIPRDEEEKEEEEEEADEAQAPQQIRMSLDAESYREMLLKLSATARDSRRSVVEVVGNGSEPWGLSGVIIADNGQELLILGKVSPARESKGIQVIFYGGEQHEAIIKRQDTNIGLCIYAVARDTISEETWKEIKIASLGSSNILVKGDTMIAVGKTSGNDNLASYGLLAADKSYRDIADGQYGVFHTDISGTAAGSGVFVNVEGEVVGIIDQSVVEEERREQIAGYGISDLKDVIERLSNGEGVPYTGMWGIDVTEDMQAQGFPRGVSVKEVEADSPAMSAGIQSGDIITAIDGQEISKFSAYHSILMGKSEGSKIQLKGCRQGTGGEYVEIDFIVTVGTKE